MGHKIKHHQRARIDFSHPYTNRAIWLTVFYGGGCLLACPTVGTPWPNEPRRGVHIRAHIRVHNCSEINGHVLLSGVVVLVAVTGEVFVSFRFSQLHV